MKNFKFILLAIFTIVLSNIVSAQGVVGNYEQESIIAPDAYRDSLENVVIEKDKKHSKKVWVSGLIPNFSFYAIYNTGDPEFEEFIYVVPKQKVGDYQINLGCITYADGDIVIALNNETLCKGVQQKDYQTDIKIDDSGVKVGDVEVSTKGVKVGKTVNIDTQRGVKINTTSVMSGIHYVGEKID